MNVMKYLALCAALLGCEPKPTTSKDSPPIEDGKCVVNVFNGTLAIKQICLWKGYTYDCAYRGSFNVCENKGEAAGERPPQ